MKELTEEEKLAAVLKIHGKAAHNKVVRCLASAKRTRAQPCVNHNAVKRGARGYYSGKLYKLMQIM